MARYDSGISYDSGARYDTEESTNPPKKMAKVKLDLQSLTDTEVQALAELSITKMTGNPNFVTPQPAAATFDPATAANGDAIANVAIKETELAQARTERFNNRKAVESLLTIRALYVEQVTGGDAAKIESSGFAVQSTGTPTSSLPKPQNLTASMGDHGGEIDVSCNAVRKAKVYEWECREHVDGVPPGPWAPIKTGTRSSYTATGLVPGRMYAFRVRCLGPNDTVSPWSDEAVCMAPAD